MIDPSGLVTFPIKGLMESKGKVYGRRPIGMSYEREKATMRFIFIKNIATFNQLEIKRQGSYTKVLWWKLDDSLAIGAARTIKDSTHIVKISVKPYFYYNHKMEEDTRWCKISKTW